MKNKIKESSDTLKIEAEFLFEFRTFSQWVNKATILFKPYKFGFATICLDRENNVCHIGEDFMNARDKNLFPVKVYSLQRAVIRKLKTK